MKQVYFLAIALLLLASKQPGNNTWTIDKANAKVGFTVTHLMVSDVNGWFKSVDAKITTTKDDFSDAVVEFTAKVNSINTDNDDRDAELKGDKFFDATKFPVITFKSKTFRKTGDKTYLVTGDITIHGVTKSIALDATCSMGTNPTGGKPVASFKVTGTLSRSDFGIGSGIPRGIVGDEVTLTASVTFDKN